jgi:serine/threonine-protein kinase
MNPTSPQGKQPPTATTADGKATRACPHCKAPCNLSHQYCPACGFPVRDVGSPEEDRFIGTTLPGGHHILDLVGVGGMGRVYRAEQALLGRTVAVKIVHPHLMADENSALRFLTEARAASQLNHPNSVSVYDFGRTDLGQPYLVMEFLRGKDLAQVAYEEGPLPFSRIADVLRQVLAALGEAHELGIVHRDLKPENVILQPLRRGGDFVKVVDFGLAKLRAEPQSTSVTSPGIVCGTPDYMAPEQGRGDVIDGRSDLYAVGVMLFQLLTGRLPFEAETPAQVVMMHLSIPAPDPRQVCPKRQIPANLAEVVKRALAKNPAQRYQDAHEFSNAILGALEPEAEEEELAPDSLAPSFVVGETINCEACGYRVPLARYCCECAAPLPNELSFPAPASFVGRDEDLAWLEARRPMSGTVTVARIIGESGSGKTRLLEEFARVSSERGDKVVTVGPDPYWASVSGYALTQAVRLLARLDQTALRQGRFEGAWPEAVLGLQELFLGPSRTDRRSPIERRHALAQTLRWAMIRAVASGAGLPVLIVDDFERIDGPSRHAIEALLADPPEVPGLVVAAHVPAFEAAWSTDRSTLRTLEGLTAREVRPILGVQTEVPQRDRYLPLYVDQAVRHQFEGGAEHPGRLADLIALRIDILDQGARRVLQGLAVLGDEATREDVAAIVDHEGPIDEAVSTLVGRGMVAEIGSHLATRHPLIRELALAGIPLGVRRELHRRALARGDEQGAPLEARAQHAYFSQESFQALLLLEQVADRATARGDGASEVLALRRCLEIARQEISRGELDDPLRAVLIFSRKLGASLTRAGDFADAEGVLREALDLAGPASEDRAKVLGALAHVAHGRRRNIDALRCLDEAIRVAEAAGAGDLKSSLLDTRRVWSPAP